MNSSRILIVDDNPEIREVVNILLSGEGYDIDEAKDGSEAVLKVKRSIYDLIILDVMMPKVNGFQACVEIRKTCNAPILFLSAKSQDDDKTMGVSSGGDDYLVKPFSYLELINKTKALIRRYQYYKGKEETTKDVFVLHGITVDRQQESVWRNERELDLTGIEYAILMAVIERKGHIITVQELYETVWEDHYYHGANNTVMVHIRNLRKKVEEDPQHPVIIKTIWGKGYRCD